MLNIDYCRTKWDEDMFYVQNKGSMNQFVEDNFLQSNLIRR